MDLNLLGKRAVITGGSKGIGREIALTLSKEGVDVLICARGQEDLDNTVSYIRSQTNGKVIGITGDLTYKHKNIGNSTATIKELVSGSHEICKKIKMSKKSN